MNTIESDSDSRVADGVGAEGNRVGRAPATGNAPGLTTPVPTAPPDARCADTLRVTVVIPTYKRPEMLARCLTALTAQTLAGNAFEVIVCDDAPEASCRAYVAALTARYRETGPLFRYIPITASQGPAGARNAGWRHAYGDIVAFTDDDTIPDPGWLDAGLKAMRPDVTAVSGQIEVPLPSPARANRDAAVSPSSSSPSSLPDHAAVDLRAPTDYELDAAGLATAEFVTANCFVRRSALQRLDGFDERYTAAWREDSDLQFRIMEEGGRIIHCVHALVIHPVRPARWGISISQQKKSQFDALLYKEHRELYNLRINARPPLHYYAIVLSALVCLLSLTGGAPLAIVTFLAFLAWLGLTIRFAMKRLSKTSHAPAHIAEMLWTSIVIPPLSIFWRLYGAVKFKVAFL